MRSMSDVVSEGALVQLEVDKAGNRDNQRAGERDAKLPSRPGSADQDVPAKLQDADRRVDGVQQFRAGRQAKARVADRAEEEHGLEQRRNDVPNVAIADIREPLAGGPVRGRSGRVVTARPAAAPGPRRELLSKSRIATPGELRPTPRSTKLGRSVARGATSLGKYTLLIKAGFETRTSLPRETHCEMYVQPNRPASAKTGYGTPAVFDMSDPLKSQGEGRDGDQRLNNYPCHADEGLLVSDLEITMREKADQFAAGPDFPPCQKRPTA